MTIERLEYLKNWLCYFKKYGVSEGNKIDSLIDAEIERENGCWHCRGIESHSIDHVKTYVDEYCHELEAYDAPLNYCPNCGRKLRGDE